MIIIITCLIGHFKKIIIPKCFIIISSFIWKVLWFCTSGTNDIILFSYKNAYGLESGKTNLKKKKNEIFKLFIRSVYYLLTVSTLYIDDDVIRFLLRNRHVNETGIKSLDLFFNKQRHSAFIELMKKNPADILHEETDLMS